MTYSDEIIKSGNASMHCIP